jgi:hypothetical protein
LPFSKCPGPSGRHIIACHGGEVLRVSTRSRCQPEVIKSGICPEATRFSQRLAGTIIV